jgi:O-antigen/teichoic acid export membrane protein
MQEIVNRLIFKDFNKTKQILYMEYVKKIIQSITIIIGIYFMSLEILIYGFIITNIIGYIINYYFSRKIINSFNFHELITIFKVVLLSVLIVLLIFTSSNLLNLEEVNIFYTLPFISVLYLLGIQFFNILDLKNEFNNALNFLKHVRKNN